jgi:hypothetical protein
MSFGDRPREPYATGSLIFGAPSYRCGAPNDLNVPRSARSRYDRFSEAWRLPLGRLIGEAVAIAGVSVIAIATIVIAGVIGVEAAIKESVAETATEPSVDEAATEAFIA